MEQWNGGNSVIKAHCLRRLANLRTRGTVTFDS
jgi:hypothetical protein